jgi:hypothetical protein
VKCIKSIRIAWLGHVMWKGGKGIPKRVLKWKPTGRRIRGGPRRRWIEDIEEDIQLMGIRGWRKLSKEMTEWRRIYRNFSKKIRYINSIQWHCVV